MIDVTGPFILVIALIGGSFGSGGIATHEMDNLESCEAAQVQLEPISYLTTFCIAKELQK